MFGFDAHPGPLRFLPAAVFLSVALAGAMAGVAIYGWRFSAARQAAEAGAQEIVRRIDVGLHQSTALLRATRALIETDSAAISTEAFARFAGAVDIVEAFPGMRGVGVARWHGPAEDEAVAQRFGLVVRTSAQSTAMRATIAMLEPRDARNLAAIGFDMNSEPNRRAAMALAAQIDDFAATGPVTLAQEITPERQTGFLIYLPIRIEAAALWGFAYAPFRLIDFLDQIGARELLDSRRARLVDATNDAGVELYVSPQGGADAKALRHVRVISFAARTWRVEMLTDPAGGALLAAPLAVSLLAAILGGFLAYLLDRLLRLSNARRVMLDEREVLLREANHRIRNAIARIGAIARASMISSCPSPTG